ncbi:L,D-transpeptidase family protein [Sebaldella termitidis]|uniref:L,D-transpeptidase family protein n=1 Tax=Sebaldella termitidis TaxID=826 RepID=UPI003EBE5DA8
MKNLKILLCSLIISVFSYGFEAPQIYKNKEMKIDGYELLESDITLKDGKPAKMAVYYRNTDDNSMDTFFNVYEQKGSEYKLILQSEKNFKYSYDFIKELDTYKNNLTATVKGNTDGLSENETREIEVFDTYKPEEMKFELKYDKNAPKFDDFLFIKKTVDVNSEPVLTSEVIETVKYPQKIKTTSLIKSNINGEWYEVILADGKKGYIPVSENVEKRNFKWSAMVDKMDIVNDFISETLKKEQKLYTISAYAPLSRDYYGEKDKFNNRPNQSVKGFISPDSKEYINIPDRTIFRIISEKDGFYEIETPFYGGPYYIKANPNTIAEETELKDIIKHFIVIDPDSQSEVIVEKADDKWNVITYSFVTTGKDNGYSSYETPHGAFLVAYSKPVMQYTRNRKKDETEVAKHLKVASRDDLVISGEALYAVRFSGGGYLHGIPATYGGGTAAKKAYTGQKIGTYKESHKCVRHYDDQIKFVYDWLGDASPNDERGHRKPVTPTVVIVL